jgi:hypothetical protein
MLRELPYEHESWEFLWDVNREYGEEADREQLRQLGLDWLRTAVPAHRSCRRVFEPLWEEADEAQRAELRRLALDWANRGLDPLPYADWVTRGLYPHT